MSEAAAPKPSAAIPGVARLLPDSRLAERASRGDERAFAAIFRRYHQALYRYCLAILGDPEDAQDALQGTMVKALQALPGEQRRDRAEAVALPDRPQRVDRPAAPPPRHRELARRARPRRVRVWPREAETRERLRTLLADLESCPSASAERW